MSAVLEAHEPSAKHLSDLQPKLVQHFELLGTAPGGVAKLRELILTLAVQGKLVPQDPKDAPASELLKKIRAEKDRLILECKIRRDKPLVAITEEEQPFTLPNGWEWIRLGSLLPFRIGKTPPSKDPQYWSDEGYAWVSISDMTHFGEVFDTSRKITASGASVFGYEPLQAGTLIMSFKLTIGKIAVLRVPAYHNEAIVSLTPLAGLQTEFLKYMLPTVSKTGASKNALMGATLNTESLSNLLIALPPEAEQSRIVTHVEELMRLCDALEAKDQLETAQRAQLVQTLLGAVTASTSPVELADNWQRVAAHFECLFDRPEAIDALEQTILQIAVRGLLVPQDPKDEPASQLLKRLNRDSQTEALSNRSETGVLFAIPSSWIWVSLEHLTSSMANGLYKPAKFYRDSGVVCVRMYNIQDGHLDLTKLMRLDVTSSELAQYCLKPGDLLINRVNSRELVGKCAVVSAHHEPLVYEAMNIRVRLVETEIMPSYVNLVLRTKRIRDLFQGDAKQAVGQASINQGQVGGVKIPLPPLREQARIVAQVETLRRLCADLRQCLAVRQTTQAHLAEALVDETA